MRARCSAHMWEQITTEVSMCVYVCTLQEHMSTGFFLAQIRSVEWGEPDPRLIRFYELIFFYLYINSRCFFWKRLMSPALAEDQHQEFRHVKVPVLQAASSSVK